VQPVGVEDEQPGVAEAEQLVVEPRTVEVDVREPAIVTVVRLDVPFEAHARARQTLDGVSSSLGPEALDPAIGMLSLGGVDTEEAHRVGGAGTRSYRDGVAVEHPRHHCDIRVVRRAPLLSQPPTCDRAPGQSGGEDRHDRGPGASHGCTVSSR